MPAEIKIVTYIIFIASLFLVNSLKVYFFIFLILSLLFYGIPFSKIKSGWIPISLFLLFTFISNLINQHGRILFAAGPVVITEQGMHIASIRTLRIIFMIAGAKILMARTGSDEIVKALGTLLRPLEKAGLPVRDFFHTMGLTMKCFPVLKNTAAQIYREKIKTEEIRGFREKAKMVSAFLLPMFIKSIQSPEAFFEETQANEKQN